jgi:hypothetical protein
MRIRYLAPIAVVFAYCAALLVPQYAHALSATSPPGAAATASPAATPVATGIATSVTNGTTLNSASTTNKACLVAVSDSGVASVGVLPVDWYRAITENSGWTLGHFANLIAAPVGPTQPGASIVFNNNQFAAEFGIANTGCNLDASTVSGNGTSASPACPTITTSNANSDVVCACLWNPASGTVSYTQPVGMTLEKTVAGVAGTSIGVSISDEVFASAGATGALTGTLSTSQPWFCFTAAIGQR